MACLLDVPSKGGTCRTWFRFVPKKEARRVPSKHWYLPNCTAPNIRINYASFQASFVVYIRYSLFWDFNQGDWKIVSDVSGLPQGSIWRVKQCEKMGVTGWPDVSNYHLTLHKFPEEPKSYGIHYLLDPWCRVLLEKLTGLQLVKKFPTFHGTRSFITALTSVRHLSLSWASPIQSIYPHLTSWRSILILSTHLRLGLPSGLLPFGFPTKTLYTPSPHPYATHAQPISSFSIL